MNTTAHASRESYEQRELRINEFARVISAFLKLTHAYHAVLDTDAGNLLLNLRGSLINDNHDAYSIAAAIEEYGESAKYTLNWYGVRRR